MTNAAPYSDDWIYVGAGILDPESLFRWFVQFHNEHFIPVMKSIQFFVLRAHDYDFRVLIALNAFVAALGALAAFETAQIYRGSATLGDFFIPLTLMNFGHNVFAWGFSAQFVMSVAAGFIVLLSLAIAEKRSNTGWLAIAYLALLIQGVTGLNGWLIAVTVSLGLFVAALMSRELVMRRAIGALSGVAAAILIVAFLVTRVRGTIDAPSSYTAYIEWAYNLVKSSLVLRANYDIGWRAAIVVLLALGGLVGACITTAKLMRGKPTTLLEVALASMLLGYFVLLAAIAFGRAGIGTWPAGLEMHYGYLMAPIPVLAWILFSRAVPRFPTLVCGAIVIIVYGDAFLAGVQARYSYFDTRKNDYPQLDRLLRSSAPPEKITGSFMSDIYWQDSPELRRKLEEAIVTYRSILRRRD
jgi:hypothetical protein